MRKVKKQLLASVSPWVLAAACGLLTLIIAVFAVNNYRRDKDLMKDILLEKGATLIRFVASSSRNLIYAGLRGGQAIEFLWPSTVQRVLEHAAGHPGLKFLALVDNNGLIIANSLPEDRFRLVSPQTRSFLAALDKESLQSRTFSFRIANEKKPTVFQIAATLPPVGQRFLEQLAVRQKTLITKNGKELLKAHGLHRGLHPPWEKDLRHLSYQKFVILVELDMDQFNQRLQRQKLEIIILSIVLILVGLGGWLSILTLEGLKGSQSRLLRVEEELRRSERLAALGKMAAGVAHELRNPLSSIKGLALVLKSRFTEDNRDRETATILVQEVERLNRSISELLDYARPQKLRKVQVDLKMLLQKSVSLISMDAEAARIVTTTTFQSSLPLVFADDDKLQQVFLNLFLNGIQAMEGGGLLTIDVSSTKQIIKIVVSDTGCGISKENLEKVFDPYFTTKPEGTGLGMAMSSKIVEEHGGVMRIESKENLGTSVIVEIPLSGER